MQKYPSAPHSVLTGPNAEYITELFPIYLVNGSFGFKVTKLYLLYQLTFINWVAMLSSNFFWSNRGILSTSCRVYMDQRGGKREEGERRDQRGRIRGKGSGRRDQGGEGRQLVVIIQGC